MDETGVTETTKKLNELIKQLTSHDVKLVPKRILRVLCRLVRSGLETALCEAEFAERVTPRWSRVIIPLIRQSVSGLRLENRFVLNVDDKKSTEDHVKSLLLLTQLHNKLHVKSNGTERSLLSLPQFFFQLSPMCRDDKPRFAGVGPRNDLVVCTKSGKKTVFVDRRLLV